MKKLPYTIIIFTQQKVNGFFMPQCHSGLLFCFCGAYMYIFVTLDPSLIWKFNRLQGQTQIFITAVVYWEIRHFSIWLKGSGYREPIPSIDFFLSISFNYRDLDLFHVIGSFTLYVICKSSIRKFHVVFYLTYDRNCLCWTFINSTIE